MLASTHFIAGAAIFNTFENKYLGAGLALASHAVLDLLGEALYSEFVIIEYMLILGFIAFAWFKMKHISCVIGGVMGVLPDLALGLYYTNLLDKATAMKFHMMVPWHNWPVLWQVKNATMQLLGTLILGFYAVEVGPRDL